MGKIQNIAKITDDPQLNIRRSDIEQRAEWFFFMNDEADPDGFIHIQRYGDDFIPSQKRRIHTG